MRTSKSVATISYNTEQFIRNKLLYLTENGKIDFFIFIKHFAEEDEKKEHFHVFIQPSGLIDTNSLRPEFDELVPDNDIPLKVMPFVSSKFSDWFMYCLHDKDYLKIKGLERKFHYNVNDFCSSDDIYFNELIHTSDFTRFKCEARFKDAVKLGMSFGELIDKGFVPSNLVNQFRVIFHELREFYKKS